jgi:hypothetical protein
MSLPSKQAVEPSENPGCSIRGRRRMECGGVVRLCHIILTVLMVRRDTRARFPIPSEWKTSISESCAAYRFSGRQKKCLDSY